MFKLPDNVVLINEKSVYTYSELKEMFPDSKLLCVCDFYVQGAEDGNISDEGITYDGVLNIDHHAPIEQMYKQISSTTLAIDYVKEHGILPSDHKIIINHTDCDAVLSSMIMTGALEPLEIYNDAAIAADHTGVENDISDLLQALQETRDLPFIMENLCHLQDDEKIDTKAEMLLEDRMESREEVKQLVKDGAFSEYNGIYYIGRDEKIESELVPEFLPDAKLVVLASPMPPDSEREWEIKVRLGKNTRDINLKKLNLPDFGCRFNAGSTMRLGGTDIELEEYVRRVYSEISRVYGA
ncbi:MAG: hypothetical protein KAI18_01335 [Candidatus Aenigmarchaeota archaeon]|nr:hypothetical protein [Candidatus Aenigmarchaeota archaeon]